MKPMPGLDDAARPGRGQGHLRHEDALGHQAGRRRPASTPSSTSSSRSAARSSAAGLVPIIEPEVDIHSPEKAEAEALLKAAILDAARRARPTDQPVMLKLTLPEADDFYAGAASTTRTCCGSWPSPAATPATRPTTGWPATTA